MHHPLQSPHNEQICDKNCYILCSNFPVIIMIYMFVFNFSENVFMEFLVKHSLKLCNLMHVHKMAV